MEPAILDEQNYPAATVEENFDETKDLKVSSDSAENFQKSIYELFNNNGILSDLRAYLRGHIVNVLKSAQNGSVPPINRNFKQRLELQNQAMNILVAEYLVCMDFNYSLSVFVSELPLPNMIFDYAQDLLQNNYDENKVLKFKEKDIWSIITYLGVKCDSQYVSNMLEMYESDLQASLLLCMVKCLPMYKKKLPVYGIADTMEENRSMTGQSSESDVEATSPRSRSPIKNKACRHYHKCRSCQSKFLRLKEKLQTRKKVFSQNLLKDNNDAEKDVDSLMKKINAMEGNLIEEMFDQLKGVYETEVEVVKTEEEKRVRMSLATQAMQLQRKQDEMEEAFKSRAEELERSVQQKKKFLWSLARALRDQHEQMARAMRNVKCETQRLSVKEENLKSQLLETEEILSRRGEDMRKQISSELLLLESHMDTMKTERMSMNKEKDELEQLKSANNISQEDFREQYNNLHKELVHLKKFLGSRFDKCLVDECTNTENDKGLNNEDNERTFIRDEDRVIRGPNQVFNDFKKFKNVNFSFDQMDRYRHGLQTSQSVDEKAIEIAQLREENEKLKRLARQQGDELEAIRDSATLRSWPMQASLQSNIYPQAGGLRFPSCDSFPDCDACPRHLCSTRPSPGSSKPGSHTRHLISQWRSLRHRVSPMSKVSKIRFSPPTNYRPQRERPKSANANLEGHQSRIDNSELNQPGISYQYTAGHTPQRLSTPVHYDEMRQREKSPKSLLREAKEKLRSKDHVKTAFLVQKNPREKSPSSVLKEAKQRLRKLEIEAEAVQKSYLNFRKRQSQIREGMTGYEKTGSEEAIVTKDVGSSEINKSPSRLRYEANRRSDAINMYNREKSNKQDFDQYLINKFETSFNMNDRFKAQSSTASAKPIPDAYKEDNGRKTENFLDKPLSEFRKLYQYNPNQIRVDHAPIEKSVPVLALENLNKRMNQLRHDVDVAKNLAGNTIITKNIKVSVDSKQFKNYATNRSHPNSPSEPEKLTNNVTDNNIPSVIQITPKNLLIEVETMSVNNLQESNEQDVFLVVQSAHSQAEKVSETESECEQINTNMTILISPKRSNFQTGERVDYKQVDSPDIFRRSMSPEQQIRLTRNDVLDSIFHSNRKDNADLDGDSISEVQKDLSAEYQDDFSADVDYYNNSGTDQTPISHRKSSDEENFWDP